MCETKNCGTGTRIAEVIVLWIYRVETTQSHLMSPQQHLYNGLARLADYSTFTGMHSPPAGESTVGRGRDSAAQTACWPTAIVALPAGKSM